MAEEMYIKLKDEDDKFNLQYIKDRADFPTRDSEVGFVNKENSSSIILKENGNINLVSNPTTGIRINEDKIYQVANERETITNRDNYKVDEIIINNQKLNMKLIEYSDTKVLFENSNDCIGNLCINGTVLVKTWSENLGRYVLIRRKIRTPMFSQQLNAIDAPEQLDSITKYAIDLTPDSARYLKEEKIKEEKVIEEMQNAEGGSEYNQGEYDNYTSIFSLETGSGNNGVMFTDADTSGSSNGNTANAVLLGTAANSNTDKKYLGEFKLTAYCGCAECNGQWVGQACKNGEMPKANYTIAVDEDVIPLNSFVEIDGLGTFKAQDTGSMIKGNRIDVFIESHSACKRFGVKKGVKVWLLKGGSSSSKTNKGGDIKNV